MVNAYVKDDRHSESHHGNVNADDDIPVYGYNEPMDIHDWSGYYSVDLDNMWRELTNYLGGTGAGAYMLSDATYTSFVEFCYRHSDGLMYSSPVGQ